MTTTESTDKAPEIEVIPYEQICGEAAVRRLADRFYEIMDTDPGAARIRAMHGPELEPIRKLLFEFLSGWPAVHRCISNGPRPGASCSAHRPYVIRDAERDEWMMCMRRAMEECGLSAEMRALLDPAFLRMADLFRSR